MKLHAFLMLALVLGYQVLALPLYRLEGLDLPHPFASAEIAGPDFLLLLLAYFALQDRSPRVLCAAIGTGLVVNQLSLDPLLAPTLSYLVAVWLLRLAAREGWSEGFWPRILLVPLAMAAASTARLGVLWLGEPEFRLPGLPSLALEVLYNALVSFVLFPLLDLYRRRLILVSPRKLFVCE